MEPCSSKAGTCASSRSSPRNGFAVNEPRNPGDGAGVRKRRGGASRLANPFPHRLALRLAPDWPWEVPRGCRGSLQSRRWVCPAGNRSAWPSASPTSGRGDPPRLWCPRAPIAAPRRSRLPFVASAARRRSAKAEGIGSPRPRSASWSARLRRASRDQTRLRRPATLKPAALSTSANRPSIHPESVGTSVTPQVPSIWGKAPPSQDPKAGRGAP